MILAQMDTALTLVWYCTFYRSEAVGILNRTPTLKVKFTPHPWPLAAAQSFPHLWSWANAHYPLPKTQNYPQLEVLGTTCTGYTGVRAASGGWLSLGRNSFGSTGASPPCTPQAVRQARVSIKVVRMKHDNMVKEQGMVMVSVSSKGPPVLPLVNMIT